MVTKLHSRVLWSTYHNDNLQCVRKWLEVTQEEIKFNIRELDYYKLSSTIDFLKYGNEIVPCDKDFSTTVI